MSHSCYSQLRTAQGLTDILTFYSHHYFFWCLEIISILLPYYQKMMNGPVEESVRLFLDRILNAILRDRGNVDFS